MLSEIGSQLAYSAFLRLITLLEREVFRIWAVPKSLSTISPLSIKVSFSFGSILSGNDGLMVFQTVIFFVTFFRQDYYNLLDFLARDTQYLRCFEYSFLL